MQELLLIVKLKDTVVVPQSLIQSAQLVLGKNFFSAQATLRATIQPLIQANPALFPSFFATFQQVVNASSPLISLYCLADAVSFVQQAKTMGNFLNYFAFVYKPDEPFDAEKIIPQSSLANLLGHNAVEYWWAEGPMDLCMPGAASVPAATVNDYYRSLGFELFSHRGVGVTIFDAEDFGAVPNHPYLNPARIRVPSPIIVSTASQAHFYNTAGILLAAPPTSLPEKIVGIAPAANLVALPFDNSTSPPPVPGSLAQNFTIRGKIPSILSNTVQTGNVLLFERMVRVPYKSGTTINLPLEVLPDMQRAMITCETNGIIVIQPAAQLNGDFDLDIALKNLVRSSRRKPKYSDLRTGSVSVMIGALATDEHILPNSNFGSMVDAYLWGENIRTLTFPVSPPTPPNLFGKYGFTSAASAIAAGIVACLQSKAKASGKRLTTVHIKTLLAETFSSKGMAAPRPVFKSFTLDELWGYCVTKGWI
jgi:hypothetical protein